MVTNDFHFLVGSAQSFTPSVGETRAMPFPSVFGEDNEVDIFAAGIHASTDCFLPVVLLALQKTDRVQTVFISSIPVLLVISLLTCKAQSRGIDV